MLDPDVNGAILSPVNASTATFKGFYVSSFGPIGVYAVTFACINDSLADTEDPGVLGYGLIPLSNIPMYVDLSIPAGSLNDTYR